MSGCGGNCDCGSGCTCGSGCSCGMYPDLGSPEKATIAATIIITGVAPPKMYSEGSEMSQEGGKGCKSGNGCKCGNSCNCDPCNC